MTEFLVTLREALEASLIVGILYTFLIKQKQTSLLSSLRTGVITAIGASIGVAYLLGLIDSYLHSTSYHSLFEAVLMFITAGILLYTIGWLARGEYKIRQHKLDTSTDKPGCLSCDLHPQSRGLKTSAKKSIKHVLLHAAKGALSTKSIHRGIFSLVFFAILREGFETVLLLQASSTMSGGFSHIGFRGGIFTAVAIAYMFVVRGRRVPLRRFFSITSTLLIVFAAGMVAYGVHETEEFLVDNAYIQGEITRVRDILPAQSQLQQYHTPLLRTRSESQATYYHVLHDKGAIGSIAKGLVGYNSNPNRAEFIMRLLTLGAGFYYLRMSQIVHKADQEN